MKERVLPGKPEWKIILEHLVYQDQVKLYRICRKMIISLDRLKVPEIYHLLHDLNPAAAINHKYQAFDGNSPKPKGLPFNPNEIIDEVFSIADKYLSDEQITHFFRNGFTRNI